MQEEKTTTKYRWNVETKKWEFYDTSFLNTRTRHHDWFEVSEEKISNIPDPIIVKFQPLIDKYTKKPKVFLDETLRIYVDRHNIVPTDFAYNAINDHLKFNNYPQKSVKLKIVNNILDETNMKTFGQIKLPSKKAESQYDDKFILDYIVNYLSLYHIDMIHKKQTTKFHQLLHIIATYLINGSDENNETLSYYREFIREKKRFVQVEKILNDSATINDLEKYDTDNIFQPKSSIANGLMLKSIISKKKWKEINDLKVLGMSEDEKQLLHLIEVLHQKANDPNCSKQVIKELNTFANDLKITINKIYESSNQSPMSVKRSKTAKRDDLDENFLADKIIQNLDYTNPIHIVGLIENYFDLYNKHSGNVDSPIFSILSEFNEHIFKIKLKPKHLKIINAFFKYSSSKKLVAKKFGMNTDNLTKMLERTISVKISNYFKKMSEIKKLL